MPNFTEKDLARLRANLSGTRPETTISRERRQVNTGNRQAGAAFEKRLDSYHHELAIRGLARVMRTNPQIRMTGATTARVIGRGECDYVAFLSSGAVVHFDAKSRKGKAFSYTGADVAHQLDWLRTMHGMGHAAGLVVWWSDFSECRWHPVSGFEKRVRRDDGELCSGLDWLAVF